MPDVAARDYAAIAETLGPLPHNRTDACRHVIDRLWEALSPTGVSWIGVYFDQPGEPEDRRLVLGPCRDKPACSPIGLHGVCGQSLCSRATRIVADVATLGAAYIACDPRDRSEIVVPLIDSSGACYGVLDVDSHDVGSFSEADDRGLRVVLKAARLIP